VIGGLLGHLVGDALGVPVEFEPRSKRRADPVTGMRGYGTHNQPPGTWSDDGSLTLCTAEALLDGFDLARAAESFVGWLDQGLWTPYGRVFDIGYTTRAAIKQLRRGVPPLEAGGAREQDNGNGSLMRILPLALRWPHLPAPELLQRAQALSCLTHAHPRSQLACGFYTVLATRLLAGEEPAAAYQQTIEIVEPLYRQPPFVAELPHFRRVLGGRIGDEPKEAILGDGYVVHTLEASLWCLLKADSYHDAALAAVNLGEDTDTTAAVAGGLAGILWGVDGIPADWMSALARSEDIRSLAGRLAAATGTD
jgi:ADP-ribosylglycohydrolase